jgi:hypothetical protein
MLMLLIALSLCEGDGPRLDGPMNVDVFGALVIQAHTQIRRNSNKLTTKISGNEPVGMCYGEPAALKSVALADVRRSLSRFTTGRAQQCYLASYYGCTIGDRVARAGLAKSGPAFAPHADSKVTLIEQSANRAVADVSEVDARLVDPNGYMHSWLVPDANPAKKTSRYTLKRDATGHWRIADREPNFEWECRVR